MSGSRGRPGSMEPPSVIIPEAQIERLQRVRLARQMAYDEKECRGDMMTEEEDDRLF